MAVAVAVQVGAAWLAASEELPGLLRPRFARAESHRRVRGYLRGLLGHAERKNGWQLAEYLGERTPQRLLNMAKWNADAVRDDLRTYVVGRLGDPTGVLIVDETGFLKKDVASAGVARQPGTRGAGGGTAGRTENCQVGVFLACATPAGCAFLPSWYGTAHAASDAAGLGSAAEKRCRAANVG